MGQDSTGGFRGEGVSPPLPSWTGGVVQTPHLTNQEGPDCPPKWSIFFLSGALHKKFWSVLADLCQKVPKLALLADFEGRKF